VNSTRARWRYPSIAAVFLVAAASHGGAATTVEIETVHPRALPSPKSAMVPKRSGEIRLDGRLDERVWRQAAVLQPFTPNDGKGKPRHRSQVRIWYDDRNLYLGWTFHDMDIQATFTQRDSRFWEEEVAEFFVTPGPLARYFELQWNPLGGVFDAIIVNELDALGASKKFEGDWSYTAAGMRSAVHVDGTVGRSDDKDRAWSAEVVIPFADLEQPTPKPGAVWRGNFYRFNRDQDRPVEMLSWSPTRMAGFHQPSRFGYLRFGE
jgi:hypothetical protein